MLDLINNKRLSVAPMIDSIPVQPQYYIFKGFDCYQ